MIVSGVKNEKYNDNYVVWILGSELASVKQC
jgi:hypothetical protein